MGWMNDTLKYFSADPVHRKYEQNKLTFSLLYAFTENFVLPFSHDEVVHGKNSLLHKMPGDMWQQFANLRLLYAYQYAHPGKKLLFMGAGVRASAGIQRSTAASTGICCNTSPIAACNNLDRRPQQALCRRARAA